MTRSSMASESSAAEQAYMRSLSDLPVGETATVQQIRLQGKLRHYVMRFGLVEGAQVHVVRRVPLGSLRVYRIGQTEVALRPETAKQIMVAAGQP